MRVCSDCSTQFESHLPSCPKCGCPSSACRETTDSEPQPSISSQSNPLSPRTADDEKVENTLIAVSDFSLKWGNILAWVGLIGCIFAAIKGFALFRLSVWVGLTTVLLSILAGLIFFFLMRIVAKAVWAMGHLYVNIAQTLKRIEANTKR